MVCGVACNSYLREKIGELCSKRNMFFTAPPRKFCTDNGSMIALVGALKVARGEEDSLDLDVFRRGVSGTY